MEDEESEDGMVQSLDLVNTRITAQETTEDRTREYVVKRFFIAIRTSPGQRIGFNCALNGKLYRSRSKALRIAADLQRAYEHEYVVVPAHVVTTES